MNISILRFLFVISSQDYNNRACTLKAWNFESQGVLTGHTAIFGVKRPF